MPEVLGNGVQRVTAGFEDQGQTVVDLEWLR